MGRGGNISLPVALALVGVAILIVMGQLARGCSRTREANKALQRQFWCEKCSKEFEAPWRANKAVCPECKQETSIVRHYYVCKACGARFLAFDMDMPTCTIRLSGQDWGGSLYNLPEIECPKCHSKETALEKYKKR